MGVEIYYFSGTGNSLYAAREMQKRLPGSKLTSIVRELRRDIIKTDADTVGLVFPNFCLTLPIPVKEFLQKADFSSARYLFAVCTRGGSPSTALTDMDRILKKKGKRLHAAVHVNMPWNHPLGKENLPGEATTERIEALMKGMRRKLDILAEKVLVGAEYRPADTDALIRLPLFIRGLNRLMPKKANDRMHVRLYQERLSFYRDEKCSGCGVCENVCLAGKIHLVDSGPVWQEQAPCLACYACVNYCPSQSIQIRDAFPIRSYSAHNGRYHHPGVTAADIAAQK